MHGARNHPVFQGPFQINTNNLVSRPTPEAWKKDVTTAEVSVIPLVKDITREYQAGWICYSESLLESPEIEIICGGLSEREIQGGAVWRQGHLLHFGFDLSPAAMNEAGHALLLNCIVYITQFSEDRPIAKTLSAWRAPNKSARNRQWIEKLFAKAKPSIGSLQFYLSSNTVTEVKDMSPASYEKWYRENYPYLTCDNDGRLMVDTIAKELGVQYDQPDFFIKVIDQLGVARNAEKARQLVSRYVPEGPQKGSAEDWKLWWQKNKSFLFFSQRAGCQWFIDPLAQRRGIPSNQLRGPARATGTVSSGSKP